MAEDMKYFYLRNHPMLELLPEQKLREAASVAKLRNVPRGNLISFGEEGATRIHFLVKGTVKIIAENGHPENESIKDILMDPDIFGDLGLEGKLSNEETAVALTDNTIICSFFVSEFRGVLEANPLMFLGFVKKVNCKLQRLAKRHADLVFLDARDRLIRFIRNWARSNGNRVGDKIVLKNYLTHRDIASFIATSRQNVNMLLNEFKSSGLLHYDRQHIELHNLIIWN